MYGEIIPSHVVCVKIFTLKMITRNKYVKYDLLGIIFPTLTEALQLKVLLYNPSMFAAHTLLTFLPSKRTLCVLPKL